MQSAYCIRIYGIEITMYFRQSEHNPPHFHARYGGDNVVIDIANMKVLEGKLPGKQLLLVYEWATMHRDELLEIWDTQVFKKIEPLK